MPGTSLEPTSQRRDANRILISTHVNIALYSLGFWIQQATLPFLMQRWEASNTVFGYLQTTFAALQLFGGPLFGRFGDLYGARLALILAFGSSALSGLLLSFSDGLLLLFVSRIPQIFVHAMQGGQMVVTDLSSGSKRSDGLGKLGMSYGIGMILGSLSSGFIIKSTSEHFAAFVAAMLSLVSVLAVFFTIPGNIKPLPSSDIPGKKSSTASVIDIKAFSQFLINNRRTRWLLLIKIITGIPIGLLQSMMPIISVTLMKVDPQTNGFIMGYVALISMTVQGLGIAFLLKSFSESLLLILACAVLSLGYFLLSFLGANVGYFFVCITPLAVGLTLVNILISSALTGAVDFRDTGSILGINMSINNIIRIVSPTLGGWMLDMFGVSSFGILGTLISSLTALYLFRSTHPKH